MSNGDFTRPQLDTRRALPSAVFGEGTTNMQRGTRYAEAMVQPINPLAMAVEGSYYVMRNPTPGTGVAHTADPTALGATDAPFIAVKNTNLNKYLLLDYLRLRCTAAGTGGTVQEVAVTVDDGAVVRYTSGGAANTPIICGPADTPAASVLAYAGALVTVANTAEKVIAHQIVRSVIPVAGDVYTLGFNGGGQAGPQAAVAADGTAILMRHIACAPVVVSPGCWMTVQLVRASQSAAASWEFELGFAER